jgi:hypothetical protein
MDEIGPNSPMETCDKDLQIEVDSSLLHAELDQDNAPCDYM